MSHVEFKSNPNQTGIVAQNLLDSLSPFSSYNLNQVLDNQMKVIEDTIANTEKAISVYRPIRLSSTESDFVKTFTKEEQEVLMGDLNQVATLYVLSDSESWMPKYLAISQFSNVGWKSFTALAEFLMFLIAEIQSLLSVLVTVISHFASLFLKLWFKINIDSHKYLFNLWMTFITGALKTGAYLGRLFIMFAVGTIGWIFTMGIGGSILLFRSRKKLTIELEKAINSTKYNFTSSSTTMSIWEKGKSLVTPEALNNPKLYALERLYRFAPWDNFIWDSIAAVFNTALEALGNMTQYMTLGTINSIGEAWSATHRSLWNYQKEVNLGLGQQFLDFVGVDGEAMLKTLTQSQYTIPALAGGFALLLFYRFVKQRNKTPSLKKPPPKKAKSRRKGGGLFFSSPSKPVYQEGLLTEFFDSLALYFNYCSKLFDGKITLQVFNSTYF